MLEYDSLFVGGRWVEPLGTGSFDVRSPSSEEVVGRVPVVAVADVDRAVEAARHAFEHGPWPKMPIAERASYFRRLVDILRPRVEEWTRVQVAEMGMPISAMRATTSMVLDSVSTHIEMASSIPTRSYYDGIAGGVLVLREPLGVIGTIIPWNGPSALDIYRILAAVLMGNPIVLKSDPEAPLSAYIVAQAILEAEFPEGVVSLLHGGADVGERIVGHPGVDKVSFTGGTNVGRRVAATCGQNLKPVTLELGGKSAGIILDDVDIAEQMPWLLLQSMANAGQVCTSTSRILVPRSRKEEIVDAYVSAVGALRVGDPFDESTQIGPLVSERQRDTVERFIESGKAEGKILLGGGRPEHLTTGWYVEPTIFSNVEQKMDIAREEIFGPVVCIMEYDGDDEAVEIANDSDYGLGGAVFTQDLDRGLRIAAKVQSGTLSINSGPPAGGGGPFGGVKNSGLGRERGVEGFAEYYEVKAIALPRDLPAAEAERIRQEFTAS